MKLLFYDDFLGDVLDKNKWEEYVINDEIKVPIYVENGQLLMKTEEEPKVIGILLGKIDDNFTFFKAKKDFLIKFNCKIHTDNVMVIVGTQLTHEGIIPLMMYTKTVDEVRYLYLFGYSNEIDPIPYSNEKIIVEYEYDKEKLELFHKMKFEGENNWKFHKKRDWSSVYPQGLVLMSISFDEETGIGPATEHHTIFDDIEICGTLFREIIFVMDGVEADRVLGKEIKKSGQEVETEVGAQVKVDIHRESDIHIQEQPFASHGNEKHTVIFEDTANKGVAFGYASLNENAKVPLEQLPDMPGGGDMMKRVYDNNDNGIVDNAEGVILDNVSYIWKIDTEGRPYLEER